MTSRIGTTKTPRSLSSLKSLQSLKGVSTLPSLESLWSLARVVWAAATTNRTGLFRKGGRA